MSMWSPSRVSRAANVGRRSFLSAGLAGAGFVCSQTLPRALAADKAEKKFHGYAYDNPFCPVSLVTQGNGIYYYATMQCNPPHSGSTMTSTERYEPSCGNPTVPPCQPTYYSWRSAADGDEPACRTDRHCIDNKNGNVLAKTGISTKMPIGEHFLLAAGQATMIGLETDYRLDLGADQIKYIRVALIMATPPPMPNGDPRPPVVMGIGQELAADSGLTVDHDLTLHLVHPKYLCVVRNKDLVHFHVLLGRDE